MIAKKVGKGRIAVKFALTIMVVSAMGVGLLAWLAFDQAKGLLLNEAKESVSSAVSKEVEHISKSIGQLKYDMTMLELSQPMQGFMRALVDPDGYDAQTNRTLQQYRQDLINLFRVMLQQNDAYFQIRLIDAARGREMVRVEKRRDGRLIVTPPDQLQPKGHRGYVQAASGLSSGEVYLSKITLNREYHTLELPYRPTIRAVMPLIHFDRKVYLVINADVSKLFHFDRFHEEKGQKTYLANAQSYYLYHPDNPEKVFGFEFGKAYLMRKDFPQTAPLFSSPLQEIDWFDKSSGIYYVGKKVYVTPNRFLVILKSGGSTILKQRAAETIRTLAEYVVLVVMMMTLVAALSAWRISRPIVRLTQMAQRIAQSGGRTPIQLDIHTGDEIEELAAALQQMLDALVRSRSEIERFAEKLEAEVAKKTKDLQKLNAELEKKVQAGIEEIRSKEEAMMQQAKMAEMGEMIGAIAHQWRQPLNALALNIQSLEDMAAEGELNEERIERFVQKNMETIKFMSKTIDDFRNFYRTESEMRPFDLKEAIEQTIELQKAQLESRGIQLRTRLQSLKIEGYKNDLMQVVLNLISNARDAIMQKREKDREYAGTITIETRREGDEAVIRVKDDAGGIPEALLHRIFEPYFTTKEEGKGTGLGLHMAKRIVEEKMGGTLRAYNEEGGAVFEIRLKVKDENTAQ